jgi:hypothetical protein
MADEVSGLNNGVPAGKPTPAADGAELRPLLMLLVLDGAVGLWSSLHAPWLQRFFISQIPFAGLVGLVWGFLEGDLKKVVAARITARLRQPVAYGLLAGLTVAFFVVTFVRSTVEVRALDPVGSEVLFRVNGAPRDVPQASGPLDSAACSPRASASNTASRGLATPTANAPAAADSELLNHLTTPVEFGMWTWPMGREVWFYTPTHVSPRAIRVWPWWRRSLQYPEEFDEVSRVRALPIYPLFKGLPTGCSVALIIREHDTHGIVLAADTLSSVAGLQLAYRDSIPLDSLAPRRWDDTIRLRARRTAEMDAERSGAPPPDSAALARLDSTGASARATLVSHWSAFRLVRTRRPLHVGERIYWEVRGRHRAILASGEVLLTHETDILLGNP